MGVVRAKITYLKALLHYVLANLQLVLDLLCILAAQGAAKLREVKFEGLK